MGSCVSKKSRKNKSERCPHSNAYSVDNADEHVDSVNNADKHVDEWPDPKDVPDVPFKGEVITVHIHSVYDGDTCAMFIRADEALILNFKIRVDGVDTPEVCVRGKMKGTELGKLEERAGAHVRDKVKALIEGKDCKVRLNKWDKYGGRVNGEVFLLDDDEYTTLAEYLLAKGYAKEYHGRAKEEWTKKELNAILSS